MTLAVETGRPRWRRSERTVPILGALAGCGALVLALAWLPVLGIADNRLAVARPVAGLAALGGTAPVVLAAGVGAVVILATWRKRLGAGLAALLFCLAIPLLGYGLGAGAARGLVGLPPAARAGLGPGAWLGLALLAAGLAAAVRRCRLAWLGIAAGLALALALAAMGRWGAFDALSLAVEYAARRATVKAALAEHLLLSGAALALACLAAVLLSLGRRAQGLVALVLGGIQVVPAVALLGATVALTAGLLRAIPALREAGLSALGPAPAVAAIAAYLVLPLWRGLALGLRSPQADTLEAARALGLDPRQILMRVRLPLGAPILVGALRVAAVQSLGLATLGALVGAGGLGRIVFDGMAQFAPDLILLGAIPVVALSLAVERGLAGLEAAARRRWHA